MIIGFSGFWGLANLNVQGQEFSFGTDLEEVLGRRV